MFRLLHGACRLSLSLTLIAIDIDCDRRDSEHPAAVAVTPAGKHIVATDSYPWQSLSPRLRDPFAGIASSSCPARPNPRHGLRNGADDEHVRHRQPS